jgi:dienelactone hydrolase
MAIVDIHPGHKPNPRYDEAAAKLAWERTLAFFNKNLR